MATPRAGSNLSEVTKEEAPRMFIMDKHGRYRAYDNGGNAPLPHRMEDVIGKRFRDLVQNEDAVNRRQAAINFVLNKQGHWIQYDDVIYFKNGVLASQSTLVTGNGPNSVAIYLFGLKLQRVGRVIPFRLKGRRGRTLP